MRRLLERYRRLRERAWFGHVVNVAAVLLVLALVNTWQTRRHVAEGPAPSFTLTARDGGEVSLASLGGKPVLLAFWAPWCSVCGAQSQNVGFVRDLVGERAHVLSVATGYSDLRQVDAYVREHEVDYPVLLGGDALAAEMRVGAFPTLYFLDAEGEVKRSAVGYTTTLGMLWRLLI